MFKKFTAFSLPTSVQCTSIPALITNTHYTHYTMIRHTIRLLGIPQPRVQFRCFSEKHSDIDRFKKLKTVYSFGNARDPGYKDKSINLSELDGENIDFRNDPSLVGLRPNSPEYKQQLHNLEQAARGDQDNERARYEFMQRMKAVGAGALVLMGTISAYQLVMNYKYLKAYVIGKWHHNWNDSSAKNLNDPVTNKKTLESLTKKLNSEIDDQLVGTVRPSETTPGIYLFGAVANKKFPMRVKGFDGKYFLDILVRNDLVVAVDDSGNVYHYSRETEQPVKVKMPTRMSRVFFSGGKIYYLSANSKELYCGSTLAPLSKGWFGTKGSTIIKNALGDFERGERIGQFASCSNLLLILTSKGRLFEINTAESLSNNGQYALPSLSLINNEIAVPVNSAYELKLLNYELVGSGAKKSFHSRVFTEIAAGDFYNVAADANNNIWTWGDNAYSQCGVEASAIGDFQPVPRIVFSLNDLTNICKYSLPDKAANGTLSIERLACASKTTFIKVRYNHSKDSTHDQDLILAFGNGLKGQLGCSCYLQKTGLPRVIKSLIGMKEYDSALKTTTNVGIKDIVTGGNHAFVVLDNAGPTKDVLVFGDNEKGQFGNGKSVKSSTPLHLPKLLEPVDFEGSRRDLAKKVNDQTMNRLQLFESSINGQNIEQVIAAGEDSSAIFYRKTS